MNKRNLIIPIVTAVVFAGAGFFGGMQYQKTKRVSFPGGNQMFNRGGLNGNSMRQGFMRNGGQPISGEIASVDNNTITIKTNDGSNKIVIYSGSTVINKTSTGLVSDLKSGEKVLIFGTTNSDGSVTAVNISLGNFGRPQ